MNDYLKKRFFLAASILVTALSFSGLYGATMTPSEATAARTKFVQYSKKYVGTPYAEGAIGPDAFDCSGFVFTCARESVGIQLPRMTKAMYSFVTIIPDEKRQTGDLLFFKTTADPEVSHVGIYLGNDQFIHSASDGPNTGVIVSSLRENYWKNKFFCTGRFLPEGTAEEPAAAVEPKAEPVTEAAAAKKPAAYTGTSFNYPFVIDTSLSIDWNFYTANYFKLTFRGVDAAVHARYTPSALQPGIGVLFRYDTGTGIFQIPIVASLSVNDYVRIYAGPVIALGTPYLPGDDDRKIQSSFFPGTIGVIWETPPYTTSGQLKIAFVQDIHYTVFNDTDNSALSAGNSIATGLVFSSGLRVTLPNTGLSH